MSDTSIDGTALAARAGFGSRVGRLVVGGLVATVGTVVVTTLAAAAMEALGVDFTVEGGEVIPVSGIGFQAGVWSLVGVVIAAALLRWSGRPADHFVRTAVVLTALSLVPPVLWGSGTDTVVGLVVLHLVAAAVMVPALTRLLRRVSGHS
jgi:hypothetical protein